MKTFDLTAWIYARPIDAMDTPCIYANDNVDYMPLYEDVMADLQDIQDNPIIDWDKARGFSLMKNNVIYIDFKG